MKTLWQAATDASGAGPERVWRRVFVATLSALYALMVLSSISAVVSDHTVTQRQSARTVSLSAEPRNTDVFLRLSQDVWRDKIIYLAWIEPAGATDQSARPPGMSELPKPGWAAVSPALDALAREVAGLDRLYPRRTVLGDEGVGSATELVAYLRPPVGRQLGGEDDALRMENGQVKGDRITARISQFGAEDGLPVFADDPRPRWEMPLLAIGFGVVPATLLLALCLSSSILRPERNKKVGGSGTTGARVRGSAIVASSWLLLPGLAVGSAAWLLLTSRSALIPLTAVAAPQGDRALPLTFAVTGALTCVVVPALAVLLGLRRTRPPASRPATPQWTNLRLLPLALSALLFALSSLTPLGDGLPLVPVATVCAVAGLCAALPVLLHRVGQRLTTSPRIVPEMVGRSFELEPARAARPFYALALLIVLALIALPSAASSAATSAVGPGGVSAVAVEWVDVKAGDFTSFRAELRSGTPFLVGSAGHDGHQHTHDEAGGALLMGASCRQLAPLIAMDCKEGEPTALSPEAQPEVARLVGAALGEQIEKVELVRPGRLAESGRAVVLGNVDVASLDAATRLAARTALPASLVDSDAFDRHRSRADQLVLDTLVNRLLILLGVAALLVAVDRVVVQGVRQRSRFGGHAESPSFLRRFLVVGFLTGWWSAGLFAIAVGYIVRIQSSSVGQREALLEAMASVVSGLAVGTLLGALAILAVGVRGPGEDTQNV